jgi:hypothetical protein
MPAACGVGQRLGVERFLGLCCWFAYNACWTWPTTPVFVCALVGAAFYYFIDW